MNEYDHILPGNRWVGTNGGVYPKSWGGNQYTGGRNAIVEAGESAGKLARGLMVLSVGLSVYQAAGEFREGNSREGYWDLADGVVAIAGTFGGPAVLAGSALYFGYRYLSTCG